MEVEVEVDEGEVGEVKLVVVVQVKLDRSTFVRSVIMEPIFWRPTHLFDFRG